MNYYNEFDPKAAAWLRELIFAGEIPDGIVDERSITEIKPHELSDYTQCHFFAGIGGWSLALKLAGWPEDKPVWTGSCPCQPFSSAGQGKGEEDERHLWPAFFNLIRERKPECVFGEQVASAIGHGWLDGISADLEGEGYACGAVVLGAHSVGAPHIRQRLYWVADASHERHRNIRDGAAGRGESERGGGLGDTNSQRPQGRDGQELRECADEQAAWSGGASCRMGNTKSDNQRRERECGEIAGRDGETGGSSAWSNSCLIPCRDGKSRRIESGSFPLAHGVSGRVGLLRGYGNAIVPQVASEFIGAWIDTLTPPATVYPTAGTHVV